MVPNVYFACEFGSNHGKAACRQEEITAGRKGLLRLLPKIELQSSAWLAILWQEDRRCSERFRP